MDALKRVWCSKIGLGALIVLSLLLETCPSLCGTDTCEREITFQSSKGSSGLASCCASDAPNLIQPNMRSKIECAARCREIGNCSGVNWKQPKTCEMFSSIPDNATHLSGCEYFGKGEK